MDVMRIDLDGETPVAFSSSEGDDRVRWTSLAVYHVPRLGRPWIAQATGHSVVEGEGQKVRRLASARLERALRLFDETSLGRIVTAGALDWAEETGTPTAPPAFTPSDDRAALERLFGPAMSVNAAARALGTNESTMRHALEAGRPVKAALRALLPFVDVAAFQAARAREATNG